jgi:hypothetical protein
MSSEVVVLASPRARVPLDGQVVERTRDPAPRLPILLYDEKGTMSVAIHDEP